MCGQLHWKIPFLRQSHSNTKRCCCRTQKDEPSPAKIIFSGIIPLFLEPATNTLANSCRSGRLVEKNLPLQKDLISLSTTSGWQFISLPHIFPFGSSNSAGPAENCVVSRNSAGKWFQFKEQVRLASVKTP
jgi:hypothetical protein